MRKCNQLLLSIFCSRDTLLNVPPKDVVLSLSLSLTLSLFLSLLVFVKNTYYFFYFSLSSNSLDVNLQFGHIFVSRVGLVSKFVDRGDVELVGFDKEFLFLPLQALYFCQRYLLCLRNFCSVSLLLLLLSRLAQVIEISQQ